MIKKSLLVLVGLLTSWALFVNYVPFSVSQYQMQSNIVKAEKFIFDTNNISNVIVGSSLSGRLQMDSLPNYYNLSLSGQSVFDGLNVVRSKDQLPLNVFIEMNLINRSHNSKFKEIVSSPIQNTLKQNIFILRSDKQPIGLFESKIRQRLKKNLKQEDLVSKNGIDTNPIFNEMLSKKMKTYASEIDTLKMDEQFKILSSQVEFLKSQNVNVIFFEMPVNYQLVKLNKASYLRKRVKNEFSNCKFIPLPNNIESYISTDGMHLTKEESVLYTNYFKSATSLN